MLITKFHFIRDKEPDEILKIYKINSDLFRCVFYPGDLPYSYSFRVNRSFLMDYVRTTLGSVVNDDVDPYHQVQLTTMIHPRILFHVMDLTNDETYERLQEMFTESVNLPIVKNGLSSTERSRLNANTQRV